MSHRVITSLVLVSLLGFSCQGAKRVVATTRPTTVTANPEPVGISDPKGDTVPSESRGYLDVLSADVSKRGDAFDFSFRLSAGIPGSFEVPPPWDGLLWSFCVDTDPTTTLTGYPFSGTTSVPCEFIVMELSQGKEVAGTLIDRRPLRDGDEAVTTPIPITIRGTQILTSISVRRMGDPDGFTWVMATTELMLPLGNDDFSDVDEVPDSSFSKPADWPSG